MNVHLNMEENNGDIILKYTHLADIIESSMKVLSQGTVSVEKVNTILGIIRKEIKNGITNDMPLYKVTVWPHLEFWSLYLKKNIAELKR